jgi:hypothetical protein
LAAEFAGVNVPEIVEVLARGSIGTLKKLPKMQADLKSYLSSNPKNYFGAGVIGGKIFNMYFDFNVNS